MNYINLKTCAKINISLDVTGVREDGYHEVCMVMHAVDLCDLMTVRIVNDENKSVIDANGAENIKNNSDDLKNHEKQTAKAGDDGGKYKIILKTDKYFIPVDGRNTAYKAAQLMQERFPEQATDVRIDIKKNIPVAAGLAGGSSNAAGVLLALNKLWKLGLKMEELCEIGRKIGADVPFCIMTAAVMDKSLGVDGGSACALAEGIGEILTPLPSLNFWAVLAKPPIGVSTPAVYKALDDIEGGYGHPDNELVLAGIKTGNNVKVKEGMGNVLEEVTLRDYPVVAELKAFMSRYAEDATMMSGSGPTVFSLFSGRKKAETAFAGVSGAFAKKRYDVFCVKGL